MPARLYQLGGEKWAPRDTSQANRSYSDFQHRPERAEFERGRTFYHALSGTIDVQQFNVPNTPWTQNVRVCAFAFNTKGLLSGSWKDRIERPSILDFGWAEASLPTFSPKVDGVHHIKLLRNRYMGIPGKEIEGSLSSTANKPLILLVYDEVVSRNALRNLGFDLSAWKSGIKDLLNGGNSAEYSRPESSRHSYRSTALKLPYDDYNDRKYRVKSRSRSPDGYTYSSKRQPSPPRERTYPPGYIVDIKAMYTALMQADFGVKNIRHIATVLGLLGELQSQDQKEPWCAGNEAVLIVANNLRTFAAHQFDGLPGPSNPADEEGDDDEDPNAFAGLSHSSIVQTSTSAPHYGSD
ncbi:hypothetical protein BDQ17DRAFT_1348851 [Cyathus striatus]|nr:hypothetical protein BDQ17DRAFT_1348851 [Cyathus striatus]